MYTAHCLLLWEVYTEHIMEMYVPSPKPVKGYRRKQVSRSCGLNSKFVIGTSLLNIWAPTLAILNEFVVSVSSSSIFRPPSRPRLTDPIGAVFPGTGPGLMALHRSVPVSRKVRLGVPNVPDIFQDIRIIHLRQCVRTLQLSPQRQGTHSSSDNKFPLELLSLF